MLEDFFYPNKLLVVSHYLFERHYCYFGIFSDFLKSGLPIMVIFNTMATHIKDKMNCASGDLPDLKIEYPRCLY